MEEVPGFGGARGWPGSRGARWGGSRRPATRGTLRDATASIRHRAPTVPLQSYRRTCCPRSRWCSLAPPSAKQPQKRTKKRTQKEKRKPKAKRKGKKG